MVLPIYPPVRTMLNPLFALDIFICSFCKCIQHTTRGQSNFPWSKLCCCYIFIVLKYWWQNPITAHIYANYDQGIVTRSVKNGAKGQMRDLEGSYFCFTDQGSKPRSRPGLAALASPRLVSSPEFPTEGLALLKSEQDPPSGMPTKDWPRR